MTLPFIQRFVVKGLHYYRDFNLSFTDPWVILVGENGVGKTTIMNILYSVLRKKWLFLSATAFDYIQVVFKDGSEVAFTQSELDAYIIKANFRKDLELNKMVISTYENFERTISGIEEKFRNIERIIDSGVSLPILYLPVNRNLSEAVRMLGGDQNLIFETSKISTSLAREMKSIIDETLIPADFQIPYGYSMRFGIDQAIKEYMAVCNKYLVNTYMDIVVGQKLTIRNKVSAEVVSADQLSSGEKQILYIFDHIYLRHQGRQIYILFDEPEMSLSLPWQRQILVDITESHKCAFILAITHSPFIFDNSLDKFALSINGCFN